MPINLNDFNRMKRAFERNGGQIDQSDEMQRYLLTRQAEGVTFNSKLIGLIREPTRSAVFEEFIHTSQHRQGKNSSADILQNEIDTAEKLIRCRKAYRIPYEETRLTIRRLRQLRRYQYAES